MLVNLLFVAPGKGAQSDPDEVEEGEEGVEDEGELNSNAAEYHRRPLPSGTVDGPSREASRHNLPLCSILVGTLLGSSRRASVLDLYLLAEQKAGGLHMIESISPHKNRQKRKCGESDAGGN